MAVIRAIETDFDNLMRGMAITALLLAVLIGSVFLCACGKSKKKNKRKTGKGDQAKKIVSKSENVSPTTVSVKDDSPTGKSPQKATETPLDPAIQEEAKKFSKAIADLAVDLYRKIATPGKNVVFSPVSIVAALLLLEPEVSADARECIRQLLTASSPELQSTDSEQLHQIFRSLLRCLEHIDDAKGKVSVANALYYAKDSKFTDDRAQKMKKSVGAEVSAVAFKTDPEAARRQINSWVSKKTDKRVPELFKSGTVKQSTGAMLANAMLLTATWSEKMDRLGLDRWYVGELAEEPPDKLQFYEFGKDQPKTVPFIKRFLRVRYLKYANLRMPKVKIVKLPCCENVDLSMFVVMPKDKNTSIESVEQTLTGEILLEWHHWVKNKNAYFSMPKFAIRQSIDLKTIFGQLGLQGIFSKNVNANNQGGINISEAAHEMFIKVDENGIEGVEASTTVSSAMTHEIHPWCFRGCLVPDDWIDFGANRPFLFVVFHEPTTTIVSMGKVMTVTED